MHLWKFAARVIAHARLPTSSVINAVRPSVLPQAAKAHAQVRYAHVSLAARAKCPDTKHLVSRHHGKHKCPCRRKPRRCTKRHTCRFADCMCYIGTYRKDPMEKACAWLTRHCEQTPCCEKCGRCHPIKGKRAACGRKKI